jgi:hypothetical protein
VVMVPEELVPCMNVSMAADEFQTLLRLNPAFMSGMRPAPIEGPGGGVSKQLAWYSISHVCVQAMATARETLDAWEEGTATGRKLAQAAAVEAAEHAANCNTYMRAANRNQIPTAALSAHDTASVHSLPLSPSVTEE